MADVRRAIGFTAGDATLQAAYPSGFGRLGRGAKPHFAEDALLVHLAKERSAEAAKFRVWLEREIVFPARRERERLGIRTAAVRRSRAAWPTDGAPGSAPDSLDE